MDAEVLVAGAGPSGLVLGCALAAQGVKVRVVDRGEGPARTSRTNILHARGVEVLTRIGALGDLPERALSPVGMTMYARSRELATMRFAPDPRESVQALFVSQDEIETRLRQRLETLDCKVEYGREVIGAAQDPRGVTVEFADGDALRIGWLIGCDGSRSAVRELADIAFPGVPVVERFLLADVFADWNRSREGSAGWFHADGMVLAIPMRGSGEGNLWRVMADVPDTGEHLSPDQIIDQIRAVLLDRAGVDDIAILKAVWTSVFRIQRRLAEFYRRERILLAGDAAHVHSPIGGQGMNTGIGDAENLAWKLTLVIQGRAKASLLDTYTAERRPLAEEVLRNTTANTRILAGGTPLTRLVRDRLMLPLLNLPAVQRQATRTASQLWVTYRKGPLGGRGPAPRPGDRVPDLACSDPEGTQTSLYDALRSGWALVADREHPELAELARRHLGTVAMLHNPKAADPPILVRPDGHLAWRGREPDELRDWLTGKLGTMETA
ncbi:MULTISPECIES: FAD-dependent monooxygenase [Glycomyces]|uniref:4,5-epoxidase n=2 Tax=Glycomyces TaxID=58113 RepID=A0A9X3PNW2_9ACTN|nr:FAD-dependent monooxygenase [Glycomyces lechevalierae]MDA1387123.1 FAD-dependent monooxygenase [Glycomyces lechevalierae]MDR7336739.1 4,5-epoxidase [Glycomyces lechevalierae]